MCNYYSILQHLNVWKLASCRQYWAYLPCKISISDFDYMYKDFINRTCQWVSVVNATHILQCTRAHACIGCHWLSANENLCLIDGVEKVVGWTPLRWNRQRSVLYPSFNGSITPHPFIYYQLIRQIHAWRWVNVWRLKNLAGNIDSLLGICKVRIDMHCWQGHIGHFLL